MGRLQDKYLETSKARALAPSLARERARSWSRDRAGLCRSRRIPGRAPGPFLRPRAGRAAVEFPHRIGELLRFQPRAEPRHFDSWHTRRFRRGCKMLPLACAWRSRLGPFLQLLGSNPSRYIHSGTSLVPFHTGSFALRAPTFGYAFPGFSLSVVPLLSYSLGYHYRLLFLLYLI